MNVFWANGFFTGKGRENSRHCHPKLIKLRHWEFSSLLHIVHSKVQSTVLWVSFRVILPVNLFKVCKVIFIYEILFRKRIHPDQIQLWLKHQSDFNASEEEDGKERNTNCGRTCITESFIMIIIKLLFYLLQFPCNLKPRGTYSKVTKTKIILISSEALETLKK